MKICGFNLILIAAFLQSTDGLKQFGHKWPFLHLNSHEKQNLTPRCRAQKKKKHAKKVKYFNC